MAEKKRLVVLGGGIAGIFIATTLEKDKKSPFEVIMVDSKDFCEYTPGVPRALIQPERSAFLRVKHERQVKSYVTGRVVEVTPTEVVLQDGKRIQFDYLVICSGSSYPSISGRNLKKSAMTEESKEDDSKSDQVKVDKKSESESDSESDSDSDSDSKTRKDPEKEKLEGNFKASSKLFIDSETRGRAIELEAKLLEQASSVIVIGGGPVGVELATEIIDRFPTKKISLVHSRPTLLERYTKKAQVHAHKFLQTRGCRLFLNTRVTEVKQLDGKFKVTTSDKEDLVADRVYFCAGAIANTSFMKKNFSSHLDSNQRIKVNEYFQLVGVNNIFAIGDCCGTNEEKTAYCANEHAKLLVENLKKLVTKKPMKKWTLLPMPPALMIISLGVDHSMLIFKSNLPSTGAFASNLKSKFETGTIKKWNQEKNLLRDWNKDLRNVIKNAKKNAGVTFVEEPDEQLSAQDQKDIEQFSWNANS